MRGVYLFGPPGVGKTALMKALTDGWERLPPTVPAGAAPLRVEAMLADGMVVGYHLGVTRERFGGTDALSYAVIGAACEWVRHPLAVPLFAEGARLAHARFAEAARQGGNEMAWFFLDAPDWLLDQRCAERGSDQNLSWRKGAASRARNAAGRLAEAGIEVTTLDGRAPVAILASAVRERIA